jgi:hypothetical protein
MIQDRPLRCSILRGGTSKGVFFRQEDLPSDREGIAALLLNVFGSPDIRQIDGLGGATSQTSKAAIIGPPSRRDADVDYTFAQVSVPVPVVDWGGNCGNLSSAVGPFAVNQGLVPAVEPTTTVRIHNTNTTSIIVATVPVVDGRAATSGDLEIPGVPGSAAEILLEFLEPIGSVTGRLLPTGSPRDNMTLADGRTFDVSVVDAANPVAFLLANQIGFTGQELPPEIEANTDATAVLEEVRSIVAEWLGIVTDRTQATRTSPGLPKIGFVAPPRDYINTLGVSIGTDETDLLGRLMSMQTAHRSYMVTGAICTAVATLIEGTVVHEVTRPHPRPLQPHTVRIGHPYGIMNVGIRANPEATDGEAEIIAVTIARTARHILDGQVYVPRDLLAEGVQTRAVEAPGHGADH